MDKLILSNLKASFNNKIFNDNFILFLEEKQKLILKNLLGANDIKDVKKLQGEYAALERLKHMKDEIIGAENGG